MSEILVVGSLAYDSIHTPKGEVDRALGGSANYFALAAHHFAKVQVVGVVGSDYSQGDMELLRSRNVDMTGLQVVEGKTFRWEGKYEGDMNEAITLNTELNVFENFNPLLPENFKNSPFVFWPILIPICRQKFGSDSLPRIVASDTMNFWITSKKQDLLEVLKRVSLLIINEGESILLTEQGQRHCCKCRNPQDGSKSGDYQTGRIWIHSKNEGEIEGSVFCPSCVSHFPGGGSHGSGRLFCRRSFWLSGF